MKEMNELFNVLFKTYPPNGQVCDTVDGNIWKRAFFNPCTLGCDMLTCELCLQYSKHCSLSTTTTTTTAYDSSAHPYNHQQERAPKDFDEVDHHAEDDSNLTTAPLFDIHKFQPKTISLHTNDNMISIAYHSPYNRSRAPKNLVLVDQDSNITAAPLLDHHELQPKNISLQSNENMIISHELHRQCHHETKSNHDNDNNATIDFIVIMGFVYILLFGFALLFSIKHLKINSRRRNNSQISTNQKDECDKTSDIDSIDTRTTEIKNNVTLKENSNHISANTSQVKVIENIENVTLTATSTIHNVLLQKRFFSREWFQDRINIARTMLDCNDDDPIIYTHEGISVNSTLTSCSMYDSLDESYSLDDSFNDNDTDNDADTDNTDTDNTGNDNTEGNDNGDNVDDSMVAKSILAGNFSVPSSGSSS